jgi:hypothetical protein
MDGESPELSAERRAQLVRKGRILYGKSCGAGGAGHCAESFARHQLRQGHIEVVRDLLAFLDGRLAALRGEDPDGLLPMTESLAARIRRQLEDGESSASPSPLGVVSEYVQSDLRPCPDGEDPLA